MSENTLLEGVYELQECIRKLQKELDQFNLLVAEERVKTGLTPGMVKLYGKMGALSQFLSRLLVDAAVCSRQVNDLAWIKP